MGKDGSTSSGFDSKRSGTGTKEWAEHNLNIQRGCQNECLYCYARANALRFKVIDDPAKWGIETLTKNANLTSFPKKSGVVMFPTASDITPFNVDAYIRVAKLVLEKGNRLLIVTKPHRQSMSLVMQLLEPWKDQIQLRFTIGALDEKLTRLWEPGAPHPIFRLDTLADAELHGYSRSVSIEPMLGGVEETVKVARNAMPWGPETIWVGKMNKISSRVAALTPEIQEAVKLIEAQQCDEEILRLYELLKFNPVVRWKDSIKEVLSKNGIEVP